MLNASPAACPGMKAKPGIQNHPLLALGERLKAMSLLLQEL